MICKWTLFYSKSLRYLAIAFCSFAFFGCVTTYTGEIIVTASPSPSASSSPPPRVGSISPAQGTIAGGTTVVIDGTNFDSDSTVTIGGVACTVTEATSTEITCTTGVHTYGQTTVEVTNPSSELTGSFVNAFTYIAPTPVLSVPAIAAATGTTAGGDAVVISGTDFLSGATVKIGGVTCTTPVVDTSVTPNTISCTTGANTSGIYSVVVTNPDSQTVTASAAYTYVAPAMAPAALTYLINPAWYSKDIAITSNTPSSAGGAVVSYSVLPALPAGLTLSTTTGIITGTPTVAAASAVYVVTATNATGFTTVNLTLGVTDFGDGSGGPLTVTETAQVVNHYTYITDAAVAAGAGEFDVADATGFRVGEKILLVQTQHTTSAAMFWEFAKIQYIYPASGGTTAILLSSTLTNAYTSGTYDTTAAKVTQVVGVPQYSNVTIPAGKAITAPAWEASAGNHYGGIIAFTATGTLTVNGSITATGIGLRGGAAVANPAGATGFQGESWSGKGAAGTGENNSGGGGSTAAAGNAQSGAGGGFATAGAAGSSTFAGTSGTAGGMFGVANLTNMFMGPGGGGSALATGCGVSPPSGSAGGGIIIIYANTLTIGAAGAIASNGAAAVADTTLCAGDVGGAGAGGSIYLKSAAMTIGVSLITATGGSATTYTAGADSGTGGAGGNGRVRLDYNTITGSSNPAVGFTAAP